MKIIDKANESNILPIHEHPQMPKELVGLDLSKIL